MRKLTIIVVMLCALGSAALPGSVQAARRRGPSPAPKTYQVTGPVLEVSNDMIVVQKGKERWEVARDANTKITGDLKVGANVTIQYRMTAAAVNVQAPKAAPKTAPKKP